jgi:hypothetical protein
MTATSNGTVVATGTTSLAGVPVGPAVNVQIVVNNTFVVPTTTTTQAPSTTTPVSPTTAEPSPTTLPGTLPPTGTDRGAPLLISILALTGGAVLVLVTRRRLRD